MWRRRVLSWLSPDGKKLLVTRILRTFAYGYLAVVLGVYLDRLGMDPTQIGLVFTAAIAGSAIMTVFWSLIADRYGRRRTVATMAALMALGGVVFALTNSFLPLLIGAFTGTISATSSEVGVFQTVEQAILPQTAPNERRTWLFSIYNTVANFAGALGSLFAATVGFYASLGLPVADLAVIFFWVGILSGASLLAAGWFAERFGLLNTMVFSHLPSNLLLMLVPLAPTSLLAVAFFLARMSISQMDVPTRQSYTMAVVDPDERPATAWITNVARTTTSAISPAIAGAAFSAGALPAPFFIAGVLKLL